MGAKLQRNLEQSRSGGYDLIVDPAERSPVAPLIGQLAFEIKRYAVVTPAKVSTWWKQCVAQAEADGLIPVLAYRADRSQWRCVVPLNLINSKLTKSLLFQDTATLEFSAFCMVALQHL
jgi:flavoprotein